MCDQKKLTPVPGTSDLFTISDLKRDPKKESAFQKAIVTDLHDLGQEQHAGKKDSK